ncbi:hypothetical protein GCM10010294_25080 [Streptomyces griseoloalbus]|uniref:DUF7218 family protein n=1 Tax=Streptomyces griseoloalbus TaxID=67303 RepID=UPI0018758566|nr:hypothetical protein GCM10010294_25080 [Streptomyces griseoloalbus]
MASKKRGITSGRVDAYEALRAQGMSKKKAAKIANAGKTKAGRSRMAKKAARTRRRK